MRKSFVPKLVPNKIIQLGDRYLIISPETGSWIIVDQKALELAKSLRGDKNIIQIVHEFGFIYKYWEIIDYINTLWKYGLINNNNNSCINREIEKPKKMPNMAIINLTHDCNLSCKYCYANSKYNGEKMPFETAKKIIEEMLLLHENSQAKVEILFHGGEPLLNFDVIKKTTEYFNDFKDKIKFEIQTNATLICKEHIKFFKKYDFSIGISIDGPAFLHDITRPLRNGDGSFAMALNGINLLREEGIDFGAIIVLSSVNWNNIDEIFELLIKLGIHSLSLNPFFESGRGRVNNYLSLNGFQLFKAYRILLHKIMAYNSNILDPMEKFEERTIKYLIKNITLRDNGYMCMKTPCGAGLDILAFDLNGDVYPCDRFFNKPRSILGNIHNEPLNKILNENELIMRLTDRSIDNLLECSKCIWRKLCNGVCQSQLNSTSTDTNPECQFRQLFIPYILKLLSEYPSLLGFFSREKTDRVGKYFYYNVTCSCNNCCAFCANDNTAICPNDGHELDPITINSLLKLNDCRAGDYVVISGGEPTLNKHLINIIKTISDERISVYLFTDGRKLSERAYCKELLETGLGSISIPIYSKNPREHDEITHKSGSFEETIAGIYNILSLRDELGLSVILELKLLFFKPTLHSNPFLLEWILDMFPKVDTISLNLLIVPSELLQHRDKLIAKPKELKKYVNITLDIAHRKGVEALIQIHDIPYCLIENHNLGFLPPIEVGIDKNQKHIDIYFDPYCVSGKISKTMILPKFCIVCVYKKQCTFINRSYFDNQTIVENIKAIFPDASLEIIERK